MQDLFLLYGENSSFLKELPASGEANLMVDLGEKDALPYFSSLYDEESRSSDLRVELRARVLEQIWNFAGPLKKMATKSPVLLTWFEENPRD